MKREILNPLYKTFDDFLLKYIKDKNSIINDDIKVLDDTYLEEIKSLFVENFDESASDFENKVSQQFRDSTKFAKLNFVHSEWLWCFSVGDISQRRKEDYIFRRIGLESKDQKNIFPITFGHAGQWHTNNKYWEIVFCITLIKVLNKYSIQDDHSIDDLKSAIEEFCLFIKYGNPLSILAQFEADLQILKAGKYAMSNILLYLSKPEKYERITSDTHKQRIVQAFSGLEKDTEDKNIDERVLGLRAKITDLIKNVNFDFYDTPLIKSVWNISDDDEVFDELKGLLFKKAIVFYGPPGTSKTHRAKEFAKTFILNQFINDKGRLSEYLENPNSVTQKRIHHLQLHSNYTYENFIGGYLLKNGETVLSPGSFLKICQEAKIDIHNENKKLDIPHVLILDELNRVDLSRLFGEVFSALEQRDQDISIGVENLLVNVPRNLYIIGTMNEIDFSLERLDFALHRRFLWFFYGFNLDRLKNIITEKSESLGSKIIEDNTDQLYKNIDELNLKIRNTEELGEMYQIGHTFFCDIVEIYEQYKLAKAYKRNKAFLFEKNGPVDILWNISIQPILETFLDDTDRSQKMTLINDFKRIFTSVKQ